MIAVGTWLGMSSGTHFLSILKSGKKGVTRIKVPTVPVRMGDLPRSHEAELERASTPTYSPWPQSTQRDLNIDYAWRRGFSPMHI